MAYIGNDLQVAYQSYQIIDDISGNFNGSTTSFALLVGGVAPVPFPINEQQCLISVGGVIQEPDPTGTNGFKFSGSSIVFSSAPGTGEDFFGVILAGADYVNVGVNYPSGSESAPPITFDTDLDTGIYNPADNELGFVTNGIGRLFISNDGKIGIGVRNPSSYNISANDLVIADPNGFNSGISINITDNNGFSNIWFGDSDAEGRGQISYAHGSSDSMNFWVGGSNNLRITSNAYVLLPSGSGGILFNGNTATANALNDYEEGTFTITYNAGGSNHGGSFTNDGNTSASYTRIGDTVHVRFAISSSTNFNFGAVTQFMRFDGLPFAPASGSPNNGAGTGSATNGRISAIGPHAVVYTGGESIFYIYAMNVTNNLQRLFGNFSYPTSA